MASKWYVQNDRNEEGPVSFSELALLIREGRVSPEQLVRREGATEWQRASSVIGLLRAARMQPAATAPIEPTGAAEHGDEFAEAVDEPATTMTIAPRRMTTTDLLWVGGVLLIVGGAVLSAWAWNRVPRFPQSRGLGSLDLVPSMRPPRPKEPTIAGLKSGVPQRVPGLEEVEPGFSPALSADLKRIIFSGVGRPGAGYDLFEASRRDVSQPFGVPKYIASTSSPETEAYPSLSPDGLEVLFVRSDTAPKLFYSFRGSTDNEFEKPILWNIPALAPQADRLGTPQFVDAQTATYSRIDSASGVRSLWLSRREPPDKAFRAPRNLPFADPSPTYFMVQNGLRAYFGGPDGGLFVVARPSIDVAFGQPEMLVDPVVTGPIEGTIWCAPQEDVLFYCSPGPGRKAGSRRLLWMIQF